MTRLEELRERYAGLCDDLLDYAEQLRRERGHARALLRRAVDAWLYEASQGNGIMEEHAQLLADIRANLRHYDEHTCTGDTVDGTCPACGREWAEAVTGGQDDD